MRPVTLKSWSMEDVFLHQPGVGWLVTCPAILGSTKGLTRCMEGAYIWVHLFDLYCLIHLEMSSAVH